MQAEYVQVPYANVIAVPVPESVDDVQAITIWDIWPTGRFGDRWPTSATGTRSLASGLGPMGQFAVLSARLQGARRVLAVDGHPSRLAAVRRLGAEVIDFNAEDPLQVVQELTGGVGPNQVIDAVCVRDLLVLGWGIMPRCCAGGGESDEG